VRDLAATTVFLDFDGTVSTADTGVHLLERLGAPGWQALDSAYVAGQMGSRECLERQWALLPHDETLLRATASEVPLDPDFDAFVERARAIGIDVVVVSDGFGFHADAVCAARGIPVVTNAVDWERGTLEFPHEDRCCACATCGTCKQAPIKDARRAGRRTILVGDGASDRKAALLVDVLFAKGALADWCELSDVPHTRFDTLGEVTRALFDS
jgi:2-hydroxy-3-keto-5-methylthiopentenyl-1-phosphate phosphatase